MARYLGGRLVSGVVTLFLFVTFLFFVVAVVLPGDWTSQFIMTGDGRMSLQEALGLDRPLWNQYVDWMSGIFTLDLGESFTGVGVWEMISGALPSTLFVLVLGVGAAFLLGAWLGRLSAYSFKPPLTASLTFVSILFLTAFPPAIAVAIERGGRNWLGFTAYNEVRHLNQELWFEQVASPVQVMWRMVFVLFATGLALVMIRLVSTRFLRRRVPGWVTPIVVVVVSLMAWRLMGISDLAFDLSLAMLVLIAGVVILTFGEVVLVTRAAMDDTLLEDYVMVARAKGLPERQVRDKYAARPALLPILSRLVVTIPYFLTGLVILESVFGGGGMGSLIFNAVTDQDIPVVVGSLLVIGVLTLLLRLGLDLAQASLDPRVRFGEPNDER